MLSEQDAIREISRLVKQPFTTDMDNLVAVVRHLVNQAQRTQEEGLARQQAEHQLRACRAYLAHVRRGLAIVAACGQCPECAEMARQTLEGSDV